MLFCVVMLGGCVRLKQTVEVMPGGSGRIEVELALDRNRVDEAWQSFCDSPDIDLLFADTQGLIGQRLLETRHEPDAQGDWYVVVVEAYFESLDGVQLGNGEQAMRFTVLNRANGGQAISVHRGLLQQTVAWAGDLSGPVLRDRIWAPGMRIESRYRMAGNIERSGILERDGRNASFVLSGDMLAGRTWPDALNQTGSQHVLAGPSVVDDAEWEAFDIELQAARRR